VVEALLEVADTTGNVNYKNAIVAVSKQVEKGVSMGDALASYPLFPPLLIQLVKVGEQTGKVDETLGKASEYFEREVDGKVNFNDSYGAVYYGCFRHCGCLFDHLGHYANLQPNFQYSIAFEMGT